MKMNRILPVCLLLLVAVGAQAQSTFPVDLEIGWRFTSIDGSEDMYRTQINEQDGFLLRSLNMFTTDFNGATAGAIDHFRLTISELGASPSGGLRLEAGKSDRYNLQLNYRTMDTFSALPELANPFIAQGIVPGQHTFDRTRQMIDADLEFLPGHRITPFIGFTHATYDGPGTTTYSLGLDEFLLTSDLEESEQEIRAGLAFNTGMFYGQVTQGWRSLSSDENMTLAPGAGAGNNPGSVLGHPITAGGITRNSESDVDTPFTNLTLTGVLPRVRLNATYSMFDADLEGDELEDATGSFASFAIGRFFGGLEETVSSRAKNNTWRGGARAEVTLAPKLDFIASWNTDHRELEGSSLINTLYRDSITFGGADPRDLTEILETDNSLERDEDVLEAALSARQLGPFALRVGYRQTTQDVVVTPDLSEIVVPGNQGGEFERTIDTIDATASFGGAGFSLGASLRMDESDDAIFRTDYLNRDRLRLRAAYHTPGNMLRVGVTGEQTDQDNDTDGIGYDGELKQFSGDIEVTPFQHLRLRASASQFRSDSTVVVRNPATFELFTSIHDEEGDAIEGGIGLFFNKFNLDVDYLTLENEGSNPFDVDRLRARVVYDFLPHTGIAAEWMNDEFTDPDGPYADYEATRYGVFLRWHP